MHVQELVISQRSEKGIGNNEYDDDNDNDDDNDDDWRKHILSKSVDPLKARSMSPSSDLWLSASIYFPLRTYLMKKEIR